MSAPFDEPTDDRQDEPEEPEDPRLSALIEALARGEAIDWQQAESAAGSAEEKEQIRALAAISEVATFHRTWLAAGGITGDLDEDEELDEEVPTHWGELEIIERVGRGSFGDVYKAREPRLDRIVALKLIRASARTPEREAETLREGRLLAKVRHPNVATVHGTAGADGRVGFWMEFLEGKNLAEILQEKGPSNLAKRRRSESPSAAPLRRFTPRASSTATSRRRTWCAKTTAASSSPILESAGMRRIFKAKSLRFPERLSIWPPSCSKGYRRRLPPISTPLAFCCSIS